MTIKVDYAVFIGKFAPWHNGHLAVAMKALEEADYVIIVPGSANRSVNTQIPFTAYERSEIIVASFPEELHNRIIVSPANDYMYNDTRWIAGIHSSVYDAIRMHEKSNPTYTNRGFKDYVHSIALVGMNKDDTSYYLNLFPQWKTSIDVKPVTDGNSIISSTNLRKLLFNHENIEYAKRWMPVGSYNTMVQIMEQDKETFARLQSDWDYENKYEALWGKGPHVTVDACVVQAGHVLLIKRGNEYGNGLFALPGGFLNRREKIEDGVIRELREETMLKVPEKVLRGSIKERKVYDNPYRSNRSHIITNCFLIELENVSAGLPKVKGSDDASEALWVPISQIKDKFNLFFEDHGFIIADLLKL